MPGTSQIEVVGCRLSVVALLDDERAIKEVTLPKVESFKDLVVWQKAMDLATVVYALTKAFPRSEEYRMTSQLTRSIVSVPANIAEGHGRSTARDYAHFIHIARGSLAESATYLLLAVRLGYLTDDATAEALTLIDAVGRMLTALRKSLMPR